MSETEQEISPPKPSEGASSERHYATGKRKNAIARVWLSPGGGQFSINGKESDVYFARGLLRALIRQPFIVGECENRFDVRASVRGGGLSGQAGALRHGLTRALLEAMPEKRKAFKSAQLITRDSRVVERKKYGRRKARRSFQFSKR